MALLSKKSKPDVPAAEPSGEDSYDALAGELGDLLGLDPEKAQRLRDVICSLAREEMASDESSEEPDAPVEEKKPSGLAILLKKGG